ncbi:glycosyltransferase [Streptomyces eurocidicus]|uniref:Glycosyltransferase involved in cell wall biosynthesis n=1 Tax=Streptomyces eurocidicus TaxID=66423 RepID=A0A7W8BBA3_STREU|nr:glycosyltransferase [Streptomyces eurocidicus]MBB5120210.1 glycosyltransferase involved in cell wall biosynthesis [Streptomyces eurocidicus]MBF6056105.1 glycosyltransferase [Streptomyces eurocidicus]
MERARWFASQQDVRLCLLVPESPEGFPPVRVGAPGLELFPYAAKPWLPYPMLPVPRRAALAQIDAALERIAPDLVVVIDPERSFVFGSWGLPGHAYARRHGVPYVAQYQGDHYNFARSYPVWRHLATAAFPPVMRYVYRHFDSAICATPYAADTLGGLSDVRIEQVPFDSVDIDAFGPDRADPAVLSKLAPRYDGRGKRLLYLGRLAREKRLDLIIGAFLRLSAMPGNEDLSLFIAGDGPPDITAQVTRLAAASSRIHLLGFVRGTDRSALYASCDAFCTACPYETFGCTVVEAMASGIPVVNPSSGGITSILSHGHNAYLFQPDSPDALFGALRAALDDNGRVTGRARADAAQFTVERCCTHLLTSYQRLTALTTRKRERCVHCL